MTRLAIPFLERVMGILLQQPFRFGNMGVMAFTAIETRRTGIEMLGLPGFLLGIMAFLA